MDARISMSATAFRRLLGCVAARPSSAGVLADRGDFLVATRRAAVRLQAARVTRGMIRELVGVPQIAAPRPPLFVRLDVLQERYAQLGGDPADLMR
jgi:hypothetical protein